MSLNHKNTGWLLIGFSVVLLLILTSVKVNVDKEGAYLCEVINQNNLDMSQCPAHQSSTSWYIVGAFGLVFIIFAIGMYLVFMPFESQKNVFKKTDMSKLDEEEKNIYHLLKQNNGSMYQSDIIKETNFSKVKTSRILDKMSGKGLIERQRRGMTNIILLK